MGLDIGDMREDVTREDRGSTREQDGRSRTTPGARDTRVMETRCRCRTAPWFLKPGAAQMHSRSMILSYLLGPPSNAIQNKNKSRKFRVMVRKGPAKSGTKRFAYHYAENQTVCIPSCRTTRFAICCKGIDTERGNSDGNARSPVNLD